MDAIGDFKNLHDGKRLFILASGPSLATLDLAPLERRIVMGLNRSALLYPDTHYHCLMDQRLFDEYEGILSKTRYLFTVEGRPWGIPLRLLGAEGFSQDLEEGIYSGYTIAFVALQVALYLGFEEIFFLGLDLQHRGAQTHFFGTDENCVRHEATEFPRMRAMFEFAARTLLHRGVRVFNCSLDSTLDAFPKVSYANAIAR